MSDLVIKTVPFTVANQLNFAEVIVDSFGQIRLIYQSVLLNLSTTKLISYLGELIAKNQKELKAFIHALIEIRSFIRGWDSSLEVEFIIHLSAKRKLTFAKINSNQVDKCYVVNYYGYEGELQLGLLDFNEKYQTKTLLDNFQNLISALEKCIIY